jgi:aminopeptidase N
LILISALRADTYTRQPGIDVVHYEISIELADGSDSIAGVTRVHVMANQGGAGEMWLNLKDMIVEQVRISDKERPFRHQDGRLSFDFGRTYRQGEIAIVEVRYHGKGGRQGMLIGKNKHQRQVYFAENWPDRARHWFPSVDHPSDKATVEFNVTAPAQYDVIANGRLLETRSLLDGRKLTRWSERLPIPTYCMVIGVAEFSVIHPDNAADIPLTLYVYPQDRAAAERKFARTKLVLEYFRDLVGPYPYEKLAQVESTTRIGGMENAGNIFYAEGSFQRAEISEEPVAHEIAHQWFGNSVTESDWDHLWISEGFATYLSALFYEHLEGAETMKRIMARSSDAVKRFHQKRATPIIDPDLTDLMAKLNAFNYQKGAWTLHMLRKLLGSEVFFKGVRRFYSLYAHKNAATEDFQRVMESVSGTSLQEFFRQWFYQPGWPDYHVSWKWNDASREAEITVTQAQNTGLFDMPLELAFQTEAGRELRSIRVFAQSETFRIGLPQRPTALEVDPDEWVLKSVTIESRK